MTKSNKRKIWVSDIIGNDYKRWKNEFVVLDCGTGCGKTHFCLYVLGNFAKNQKKKILYLCNRKALRKQVYDDAKRLKLLNIICVTSYQALQRDIQDGKEVPHFDYIVADECHYFTTDAKFNEYTDVSYDFLIKQKNSVILWVSATAKIFFRWLADKGKVKKKNIYRIDKDYSYVKQVYFYQKDELTTIIDDILENDSESKIVVFCNSASRMEEMNKRYADKADYFCSSTSSSTKLKKMCGYDSKTKKVAECIKQMPDGRITFEKRILFTTTVLDNGVNLKDKNIKHIFSEIFDVDSLIQSLGRKRTMDKEDICTFYIREFQPKAIQGLMNINEAQLQPVQLYKHSYDEFFQEYGNGKKRKQVSKNKIFYSFFAEDRRFSKIKVNECRYRKYEQDNNILIQMKELGHIPILNYFLGEELSSKSEYIVVDVKQIDMFMEYLKSIEGKPLYREDREHIKEEFESIGVKLRYTGINTFNGALEDNYKELYLCRFYSTDENKKMLVDKRRKLDNGQDNPNRDKTYWILEHRVEDC
ncbi:MAG: hypothetical protein IJN64_14195 [Lachnospiraceae bacterium]|nr:hypothetical protein [Lachnospiraceae bacterium]